MTFPKSYLHAALAESACELFPRLHLDSDHDHPVNRGIEVGIHLTPGLPNPDSVAVALGNLAAFSLEKERHEQLQWQVIRVEHSDGDHHYRLILRRPFRLVDAGLGTALARTLDRLSQQTPEGLRILFDQAKSQGLHVVELRSVDNEVDYWTDPFWTWFGWFSPR